MDKFQTTLAQLQLRLDALTDKHTITQAALADAVAARDQHNLIGDIADEQTADKLQAKVDNFNSTLAGLDAALATLRVQIGDTETQIAAERSAAARQTASAQLEHDLNAFEKTLAAYLKAARDFTSALEPIEHWHYETGEMSRFVTNGASQVEIAGALGLQELRGMVEQIKTGAAAIPPKKSEPAPPVVTEPAPETRRVFALRSVKWKDNAGQQRFGKQYTDLDLPPVLALRGLRLGALINLDDERRARLRDAHGGHGVNPDAIDVLDLDEVSDASGAKFVGPDSDPVIQAANFTVVSRGPERKGTIAAQRLL